MWKVRSRTATADATSSTTKITRPYRRHLFPAGLAAAVLWLHLACPVRAEVDSRIVEAVGDAARELGDRFSEIRRDVLGADALAEEYERVGFDYTQLDVSGSLSTEFAEARIEAVLDMIMNVSVDSSSDSPLPSDCCTDSSRSEVCCHGCTTEDPLLSAITDSLSSNPSLEDTRVEIEFGHVSGALLRYSGSQTTPTGGCVQQDSNLQPWYTTMIRSRPLEIVLVIDLNAKDVTLTQGLRNAALTVLNSLNRQDKVQVVLVGKEVLKFVGSDKVFPVCASYLEQLREFVRLRSPPTIDNAPASYVQAFKAAFNSLHSDNSTDKLILFFTTIHNWYVPLEDPMFFDQQVVGNVAQLNAARQNSVVISAYYNGDRQLNFERLTNLVNQPIRGVLMKLESEYSVKGYYDLFNSEDLTEGVQELTIGRDIDSRRTTSLSIIRTLKNETHFFGVFRALLPWEMLFPNVADLLESGRGSSHFFVVNGEGEVLYHPLVPGDFQSVVSVGTLESQELLDEIMTRPTEEFSVETQKPSLAAVPVRGEDENAFISRQVAVTYTCRPLQKAVVQLYVCAAVAEGDFTTAELKNTDIAKLYMDSPERAPLYHTSEVPEEDQCFYFCSISSKEHLSVQLTGPNNPPTEVGLSEIDSFLKGGSSSSSTWAEEGVANEVGVVSVIGSVWRGGTTNTSDYVVRRHLATPSGVYLAYPFTRLAPDFVAPATEWFILSSAHPHTLTITPPRPDTLWGAGHVVSVGAALSTPPQNDEGSGGGLLAVVAADLTLPALRALVEDAMPLCTTSGYNCFILDDQGNILYHEFLFTEFQPFLDEPIFFVRPQAPEIPEFREILINVLNESVALKMRCIDYLNQTVRQRLFFSFDIESEEVHAVSTNGIEYAIQNIPGTNALLGIVKNTKQIDSFCFCSKTCQTCGNNERGGCECPCKCPEDCTTPHSFPPCPPSIETRDQLRTDSAITTVTSDIPDFCFPLDCSCKTQENDCAASRDCHWCPGVSRCRYVTECCSVLADTATCCSQSPFTRLPSCMNTTCTADIEPPLQDCVEHVPNPSSDATASIVGGVLGALLVLVLVLIGAGFILWAKYCKKPGLYEEDDQKESNFDFSNSKPKAKNPLNDEQVAEDVEVAEQSSSPSNMDQKPSKEDTTL